MNDHDRELAADIDIAFVAAIIISFVLIVSCAVFYGGVDTEKVEYKKNACSCGK